MKNSREDLPYSQPDAPPEPRGVLDETLALYHRLAADAVRRCERERAQAKARGPVAKALNAAALGAGVLAAVVFFYGVLTFTDAPIRQTPQGYAGKLGAPHTREEYERFKLWEKSAVAAFALTFLTAFGAVAAERRSRPRGTGHG